MKRRGVLFCCMFILALVLVYLQPVFFQPVSHSRPVLDNPVKAPTNLNYEPIKADGLAKAIGESLSDFEEEFGSPIRTYRTGYDFEVRVYNHLDDQQYLEINTDGESVQAIKVIGQGGASLAPFSIGMTMTDLTEITMIYPNFTLKQNDRSVSFELMEQDMNYRPLVAFDNGTFAVLFFDQTNSELVAVAYLDQATLLKLSPYQLTEGELLTFQESQTVDQETADLEKETLAFVIIEKVRNQKGLESMGMSLDTHKEAKELVQEITNNLSDHLTSQRIHAYQKALTSERTSNFTLTPEEWRDILKEKEIDTTSTIFEAPVYDPTFTILSWYSDPTIYPALSNQTQKIGIAFSKENMVVLIQEDENEHTEDSTSDDL
ncbi:CAP-associated domain-containing protein [Enterococcus sp.]|jgi:uncharacterized protein YkwD|uniref:CAP-associated domain-containing protein n=1 Tax=Enterococcus sp. TaxID=35783 RepID=UPI0025BE4999|nr:CAP-associated domain-containing protein [Enterococcus sp.]